MLLKVRAYTEYHKYPTNLTVIDIGNSNVLMFSLDVTVAPFTLIKQIWRILKGGIIIERMTIINIKPIRA